MDKYYSITELTREFGVSTRTLRFYEDEGLIHPERRGRTRVVPKEVPIDVMVVDSKNAGEFSW